MYIPDWFFLKKLQRYDAKLNASWDDRHSRWQITRTVPSPANLYDMEQYICHVVDDGGGFLPLDDRVIRMLSMSDHHRRGSKAVLDEMIKGQIEAEEAEDRSYHNDMEAIAGDLPSLDDSEFGSRNIPKEDMVSIEEHTEASLFVAEQERVTRREEVGL